MNTLPDEILVLILDHICTIEVPYQSNDLLNHLDTITWRVKLFNTYLTLCTVCSKWNLLMINDICLPYHEFNTSFKKVETVRNIEPTDHTRFIVWNDKLRNRADIIKRIENKTIKVIGYRTYSELIDDYNRTNFFQRKRFIPHNFQSLITLKYITRLLGLWSFEYEVNHNLKYARKKNLSGVESGIKNQLRKTRLEDILKEDIVWNQ